MPDAATQSRQEELRKRHRDLTKPEVPFGSDLESIQKVWPNLTEQDLSNRATFNLKDHMQKAGFSSTPVIQSQGTVDLAKMSREELLGLADAALTEASRKEQ